MLYDELADIHSDLAWALLEVRLKLSAKGKTEEDNAIARADAALERLSAIIAVIAEVTQQKDKSRPSAPPSLPPERRH
jgi:hypothetical protein